MADKLNLKVLFDAQDRITGPIKKIISGSNTLAASLKATKDNLKGLDKAQKDINAFRKLSKDAAITTNQLKAAQEKVKELKLAMEQASTPTKAMSRELEAAKRAAAEFKGQSTKLQYSLHAVRGRLNEAGMSTNTLATHQRELTTKIEAANKALKQQEDALGRVNARLKAQHAARAQYDKGMSLRNKMAGAGMELGIAGAVVGAPVARMVKDYGSFEDAMLGVAKQVEGARDENGRLTSTYYDLADGIKTMSLRIPMATTELAALVEAGARMGVQGRENLLKFTETSAITATAFDLPVEQVGEQMGKLANLYKIPIQNIGQLGDVINWLDDNALSKGGDIINVMQRIAGTAATVGMSYKDAAALGSAFLTLGSSAEVAATASNAMMRELAIANMQPKKFQAGMKALGLDSARIQKQMAKDATGTIQHVLTAINKLPESKQLEVTTQLFGKEYGDDAAKLAKNIEEYRRQLKLTNDVKASGSMFRESAAKNDTLSAQNTMGQNRLFNLSAELGANLRQPLMEVMGAIGDVVGGVAAWTKAHPGLTSALVKGTAALSILLTVLGAVSMAMAAVLGPMVIARYGLTLFGIQLGRFGVLGAVAKGAITQVGTAFMWVARLAMANPVIAIATGIATVAFLIWRNWAWLKAQFSALWDSIPQGAKQIIPRILMSFLGLPGQLMAIGGQIMSGLVNGMLSHFPSLQAVVQRISSAIPDTVKSVLNINSPSRVFMQIGAGTMEGLHLGLESGGKNPLNTVQRLSRQIAGIGAGIAIGTSTALAANLDTRPPIKGAANPGGAGGGDVYITVNVQPSPGMDEAMLARLVEQKLELAMRQTQARKRSRLTDSE